MVKVDYSSLQLGVNLRREGSKRARGFTYKGPRVEEEKFAEHDWTLRVRMRDSDRKQSRQCGRDGVPI